MTTKNDGKGTDHPLISNRSPSLARAQREHADPSPTPDPELVAGLCRLVEVEHAVAAAYEASPGEHDERAGGHRDAALAVTRFVAELGGAAPTTDEADEALAPVSATEIAYIHDRAQLERAFERNEKASREARALAARLSPAAKSFLAAL